MWLKIQENYKNYLNEELKKMKMKKDKINKVMDKIDKEMYILTVPKKFPEAYKKSL